MSKQKTQTAAEKPAVVHYDVSFLTDDDIYLFNEGSHFRLYEKLGSHLFTREGVEGTYFAVWAPDAEKVSVVGDFNGWDTSSHPLQPRAQSGIWEGFITGVKKGAPYKYHILSRFSGYKAEKADPFAVFCEVPPNTASIVWDLDYAWGDSEWMAKRAEFNGPDRPMAIYEMHLGSWMRAPDEENRPLTYREIAPKLKEYMQKMNFTQVEFLP
ncbi:MAG: 1,4-alpha-glucan branching enzyme, partial [Syntrophobacterales bacterium]